MSTQHKELCKVCKTKPDGTPRPVPAKPPNRIIHRCDRCGNFIPK